jgi:hypothetical protein
VKLFSDKSGDTALSWAEEWENWECIDLLRYTLFSGFHPFVIDMEDKSAKGLIYM